MKLFLTIIPVENGFRVTPGSPADDGAAQKEYVFESLESMNKWLPIYTAKQLNGSAPRK
jgi:hypothetical protein